MIRAGLGTNLREQTPIEDYIEHARGVTPTNPLARFANLRRALFR
jgi:hypothetical protein